MYHDNASSQNGENVLPIMEADEQIVHEWITKLFEGEITEASHNISNERIWALGAITPEESKMHIQNIANYTRYMEMLNEFMEMAISEY